MPFFWSPAHIMVFIPVSGKYRVAVVVFVVFSDSEEYRMDLSRLTGIPSLFWARACRNYRVRVRVRERVRVRVRVRVGVCVCACLCVRFPQIRLGVFRF